MTGHARLAGRRYGSRLEFTRGALTARSRPRARYCDACRCERDVEHPEEARRAGLATHGFALSVGHATRRADSAAAAASLASKLPDGAQPTGTASTVGASGALDDALGAPDLREPPDGTVEACVGVRRRRVAPCRARVAATTAYRPGIARGAMHHALAALAVAQLPIRARRARRAPGGASDVPVCACLTHSLARGVGVAVLAGRAHEAVLCAVHLRDNEEAPRLTRRLVGGRWGGCRRGRRGRGGGTDCSADVQPSLRCGLARGAALALGLALRVHEKTHLAPLTRRLAHVRLELPPVALGTLRGVCATRAALRKLPSRTLHARPVHLAEDRSRQAARHALRVVVACRLAGRALGAGRRCRRVEVCPARTGRHLEARLAVV